MEIGSQVSLMALLASSFLYFSASKSTALSSSSFSNNSLARSFHAPKWYSSKITKSQLVACINSFLVLMPPLSFVPSKSWNEPNTTIGFDLSVRKNSWSMFKLLLRASLFDTYCQPSKSICETKSSRQADSTAGLKVRINMRDNPIFFAN